VNWLLDRLEEWSRPAMTSSSRDRALLLSLLDRDSTPLLIVGDEGRILATNAAALPAIGPSLRPTELVTALTHQEPLPAGWQAERVEAAQAWICRADPGVAAL
jgi:hypothetical protein